MAPSVPPPSGRWPRWRQPRRFSRTPPSCSGRTSGRVWFLRVDGPATLRSRLADFPVEAHDVGTFVALVAGGVLRADMVGLDLARRLMLAGLVVVADD